MKACDNKVWSEHTWNDVAPEVERVNPDLAKLMAAIMREKGSNKQFRFVKASYAFGDEIVSKGQFTFPCQCPACAALTASLCEETYIPLAVVIRNRVEVLIESHERRDITDPLRILTPGDLFGDLEIAHFMRTRAKAKPEWTLYAGARSIIPVWQTLNVKINEVLGLPKHDSSKPDESKRLWQEKFWPTFRSQLRAVQPKWSVDIVLIHVRWSQIAMGHVLRALIFETAYERSQLERGLSADITVAPLLRIAKGTGVGFSPNIPGDELGPFNLFLEQIYQKIVARAASNQKGFDNLLWEHFPPLPLILLPAQLRHAAWGPTDVFYFSSNNPFIRLPYTTSKHSADWKEIAYWTKRRLDEVMPNRAFSFEVFVADTAREEGSDVEKFKQYVEKRFLSDFRHQLSIAQRVHWGGVQQCGDDERAKAHAFAGRNHGFLVSFARFGPL